MSTTQQIVEQGKSVLIGNYARLPVVMQRGAPARACGMLMARNMSIFSPGLARGFLGIVIRR